MKLIFLSTLVFFFLIGGNVYGQKKPVVKDSIPQEKKYVFVEDVGTNHYIDSVLVLALRVIGYELPTKDTDGLRNGMSAIINFRRQTAHYQDSVYNSQLKPKK